MDSQTGEVLRNYGPPRHSGPCRVNGLQRLSGRRRKPTEVVDNFVKNCVPIVREATPDGAFDRTVTEQAAKNPMESNGCYVRSWFGGSPWAVRRQAGHLWSIGRKDRLNAQALAHV